MGFATQQKVTRDLGQAMGIRRRSKPDWTLAALSTSLESGIRLRLHIHSCIAEARSKPEGVTPRRTDGVAGEKTAEADYVEDVNLAY